MSGDCSTHIRHPGSQAEHVRDSTMATNRLHEIEAQGTAVWIDGLSREALDEGTLERLIADDGVTGVTSNPTTFKKAMEDSERYDRHLREAIAETSDSRQVYFR